MRGPPTVDCIVKSEVLDVKAQAKLAKCLCGSITFMIFEIQTHLHYQCPGCNRTYCEDPEACKRASSTLTKEPPH